MCGPGPARQRRTKAAHDEHLLSLQGVRDVASTPFSSKNQLATEYRTYRVTMPVHRKKMPQAILKALTDARLIRKTKDAATVLEVEPEAPTGFIQLPIGTVPTNNSVPMGISWTRVATGPTDGGLER